MNFLGFRKTGNYGSIKMNDFDCMVPKNFICEYQKTESVHEPYEDMSRVLTSISSQSK